MFNFGFNPVSSNSFQSASGYGSTNRYPANNGSWGGFSGFGFGLSGNFSNLFQGLSNQIGWGSNTGWGGNTGWNSNTGSQTTQNTTPRADVAYNMGNVRVSIPSSTWDNNVVQFRNSKGAWQNMSARGGQFDLTPSDVRIYNQTQGTYITGDSAGARINIERNGDTTVWFEDRTGSNAENDQDYNDVTVVIGALRSQPKPNDTVQPEPKGPNAKPDMDYPNTKIAG